MGNPVLVGFKGKPKRKTTIFEVNLLWHMLRLRAVDGTLELLHWMASDSALSARYKRNGTVVI